MASPSTCQTQRVEEKKEPKSSNSSKSCFQPTVSLKDWWLIRAERDSQGRTLAVAGRTSREGQALRGFTSAPIHKIYDVFNLETIDGICVVLKGFINRSRSEENGFPSEVIEQFLFGFPPQWETFNEKFLGRDSKEVKDLKNLDQNDYVETTGETIQDHNGRKDYEVEDNLMRDNQNDGEVASEVIVQTKTKRATRSSDKLNFTNTSTSIAEEQTVLDHHVIKDYEVEDNLMRDSQNDGEIASEVIVKKKTKRATRSSEKLNSTNTSTSISKEQTILDHNGIKVYEVEDNLIRDSQYDGEVASEVILQKKEKRATRSSDKLNSTKTSTSIAKEQRILHHNVIKDYEVEDNLMRDNQNDGEVASEVIVQTKTKRATRSSDKLNFTNTSTSIAEEQTVLDHHVIKDYEVEDNLMRDSQNAGEVASEVIVKKKTKRATRSSDKLNSTNTSTSISKEQTILDHNGIKVYEVEDNLIRDSQYDGEVTSEVILQKKEKRATRSSDKLNSKKISISIGKEQRIQDHNGRKDYEVEDNLMRDNQNDGEVASEVIVQTKTKRATRSSDKLNFTNTSTSIAEEQTVLDHLVIKDYEVEDNLMRDSQNDGEVASEVIVKKKTKRATRSSDKLNSTNTSTSISKEQTILDHNGIKVYEVEDNLIRDSQYDGEVASEVILQKKEKRATRSSDKMNSTKTSTSIGKEQRIQDHNGRKDYEVEDNLMRDNQNDGELASEVIVQKNTKSATRSTDKLNSTNTSTSIAKEQTILDHNGRKDCEVEDNLMRDNQNDGEVASEVIVQKKTKTAMRSLDMLNSTNSSSSIAKEQTADVNRTTHFKSSSTENAKRKLSYGSPQQGKEAVRIVSPEPLSFNRSRSGRVLLPPMAFWRNQRAVYDADQSVTEVKQGDPNLDYLSRVCRSEPSKKRRQRR
ncbi:kinetochore-associated protein KNL-2 homolog isoform X2 [Solanum lycopersicum]|uniref:kinetochore-associated protein KNL-2 homolog isoform X2 n=1 Tax=Solanum lycopersicum TaxID=4081 RepID=UPI003748CD73